MSLGSLSAEVVREFDPKLFHALVAFRRDLHQHPELSWEEERTAARIEGFLDELGIAHRRVTKTGVVADVPGCEAAPIIALARTPTRCRSWRRLGCRSLRKTPA